MDDLTIPSNGRLDDSFKWERWSRVEATRKWGWTFSKKITSFTHQHCNFWLHKVRKCSKEKERKSSFSNFKTWFKTLVIKSDPNECINQPQFWIWSQRVYQSTTILNLVPTSVSINHNFESDPNECINQPQFLVCFAFGSIDFAIRIHFVLWSSWSCSLKKISNLVQFWKVLKKVLLVPNKNLIQFGKNDV